jgi:N-acetylmuramoyl-L-alanine amidase
MARIMERPSPNFDARPAGQAVDMLILHYTGMESAGAAFARMGDPAAKVSAHYCIEEDGALYRLVDEKERAWHAGVAEWGGRSDVNARSIGIELINPGHEFGYRPFPEVQIAALMALAQEILARHLIPPRHVLGHSDVAPLRKEDPGELFDWARLAAAGIGLWPGNAQPSGPPEEAEIRRALAAFGYGYLEEDLRAVVTAFQRHFRPDGMSGDMDAETAGRLNALLGLERL